MTKARLRVAAMSVALVMGANMAKAAEIKVMASAAVKEAYTELAPAFEKASGHKVVTEWVPTVEMLQRLKAGEAPDLVILSAAGIEELTKDGKLVAGSRVDVAKSGIAMAVKTGTPKPDISTVDAFKKAVLAAKSVAYSTGPSGVYLAGLFEKQGLTAEVKPKLKVIQGVPVGEVVAKGEAEIGFQQVPELLPVKGIDLVGELPAAIQQITVFAGALPGGSKQVEAAKALVAFLKTPTSVAVFKKSGMEGG